MTNKDRAEKVARLRAEAARADERAPRWPSEHETAERLRGRANRLEAGQARTADDFVDDYNDEADRLHTNAMVDEMIEHAKMWEFEVRFDAYSRAMTYLASAHGNLVANGEHRAADLVEGWLQKALADKTAWR